MYPPEHLDGLRQQAYRTRHPFEPEPPPEPLIQMSRPPRLSIDPPPPLLPRLAPPKCTWDPPDIGPCTWGPLK